MYASNQTRRRLVNLTHTSNLSMMKIMQKINNKEYLYENINGK